MKKNWQLPKPNKISLKISSKDQKRKKETKRERRKTEPSPNSKEKKIKIELKLSFQRKKENLTQFYILQVEENEDKLEYFLSEKKVHSNDNFSRYRISLATDKTSYTT